MTGSIDEVRAVLAVVTELLDTAGQCAGRAAAMIDESVAGLVRVSEQHSESVVPAELLRAADGVRGGIELVRGCWLAVTELEARL